VLFKRYKKKVLRICFKLLLSEHDRIFEKTEQIGILMKRQRLKLCLFERWSANGETPWIFTRFEKW